MQDSLVRSSLLLALVGFDWLPFMRMFTFLEELLLSQFVGVVYPESALTGLENKKVTRGPSTPGGGLTCPAGRV